MITKKTVLFTLVAFFILSFTSGAMAQEPIKMTIQSAGPAVNTHTEWLKEFCNRIEEMAGGRIKFEILFEGSVVPTYELIDAVHEGVLDGASAYPHFWSGRSPAGLLFGAPTAGLGMGLDEVSALNWITHGEGAKLYEEYYQKQLGLKIKPFVFASAGPEPLGWFKKPIKSLEDFRKVKYRAPPGIPTEPYRMIGIPAVSMPGGEIVPAAQRGAIDGADLAGPAMDIMYGIQNVFKHLYLEGLHQIVSISDLYINLDKFNALPKDIQVFFKHGAMANIGSTHLMNTKKNAEALKKIVTEYGVTLHETPTDFIDAYMEATQKVLDKHAAKDAFFAKVLKSQREFARLVVPWRAYANGGYAKIGKAALKAGVVGYKK
jgi:TRAP-type mannitol/chloroaromatic compound transport system substrate-binding protein